MNTLAKIVEKPVEKVIEKQKEKKNYKKFQEEKERIEMAVNSRVKGHNDEYRRCEKTSEEGMEDRWYVRKLEIEEGRYIQKLAEKYGIKKYKINFTKLY